MAEVAVNIISKEASRDPAIETTKVGFEMNDMSYLEATNSDDAVNKVLAALGPSDCIAVLRITGHGSARGTVWLGTSVIQAGGADMQPFARLAGKFCPSGVIVLDACKVGQNLELLKSMSRTAGGPWVIGSQINQNGLSPHLEGMWNACKKGVECRVDNLPAKLEYIGD